jgi:hypothetical protein
MGVWERTAGKWSLVLGFIKKLQHGPKFEFNRVLSPNIRSENLIGINSMGR